VVFIPAREEGRAIRDWLRLGRLQRSGVISVCGTTDDFHTTSTWRGKWKRRSFKSGFLTTQVLETMKTFANPSEDLLRRFAFERWIADQYSFGIELANLIRRHLQ
jgi:hypothetical protein